jgi:hypothetical protein
MLDFFLGIAGFVVRVVDFLLGAWVGISRLKRFANLAMTGRAGTNPEIEVPVDPKPPAVERALAEAEWRCRNGAA